MTAEDFRAAFTSARIALNQYESVGRAVADSEAKLTHARTVLADLFQDVKGCAVFAFGSLGRMELTAGSDLDVALVYDHHELSDPKPLWERAKGILTSAGFHFEAKTFARPVRVCALTVNIGGDFERNRNLTYRVLLLTEGEWLGAPAFAREVQERLVRVYKDAPVTRGLYLTSLSNDLHRYYRTLCIDYRHKVEERGKEWGIRYIKLRHSRKLWHLGNICLEASAYLESMNRRDGDGHHDGYLSAHLRDPPLIKVLEALRLIGAVRLMGPILRSYEIFLSRLGDKAIRSELEAVKFEEQGRSMVLKDMKHNADDLNRATTAIVRALLRAECGDHLIRYGVL